VSRGCGRITLNHESTNLGVAVVAFSVSFLPTDQQRQQYL